MKCSFCGLPVIIDDKLNEKLAEALDDFVSDKASVEFLTFQTEDNEFLQLCIKELAALKKRFPDKDITITAVLKKNGPGLGDYWRKDENGEKSLIWDNIILAEKLNRVENDWDIWTWILSQCPFIFEYGYDKVIWRYKQKIRKTAASTKTEILPLYIPETIPAVTIFNQLIKGFMILKDRNELLRCNKNNIDKKLNDDIYKIVKLFKYYGLLPKH